MPCRPTTSRLFRYLQGIEKERRSRSQSRYSGCACVREDDPNGWLIYLLQRDTQCFLKPVYLEWLSIAIRGLLAMGENRNRRVWIFADELPTAWHKLSGPWS
nr:type IV secretion system DNA-binding domain-containing protein [Klebsiella pneumoniae]